MPITNTLQNTQKLRDAGRPQSQAEAIAEMVEQSQQSGFERFTGTLTRALSELEGRLERKIDALDAKVDVRTAQLEAKFESALRDQLIKVCTIVGLFISVAVVIIKLLP